jgi:hypothetical protein
MLTCATPLLAAVLLASPAAPKDAAAGGAEGKDSFKMTADARLTMRTQQGNKHDVTSTLESLYTWHRPEPRRRVLTVESMNTKLVTDGATVYENAMSGKRFFRKQAGQKTVDMAVDDAPERAKTILRETFGKPLVELELDAAGKEVKRTVVMGEAARGAAPGLVDNLLFLNPPPPAGREAWESDAALSGEGVGFKGRLSYKKAAAATGPQTYAVSGTLTNPAPKPPEGKPPEGANDPPAATKASTCVVTGEHTFDPVRRQWVAARLKVDMSIQNPPGRPVTTTTGTMVLTLEAAPEKK